MAPLRSIAARGLLVLLVLAAWAPSAGAGGVTLLPGLEFSLLSADETVRSGSGRVAVLTVDPARFSFRVLAAPPGAEGFTAGAWREKTGAIAVFNAGQYAADRSYLGLLVTDGQPRGRLAHKLDGLFVAGPKDAGLPRARVIDLRYTAFDPAANPYRQVAQSLMLLDRFGHIRVRRSPRVAHRTAVAQDRSGRILVIITEGRHTLWEFAGFLQKAGLNLLEVMSMDGGSESQLDLKLDGFSYRQYGEPTGSPEILPWPSTPLPVAVGVFKNAKK